MNKHIYENSVSYSPLHRQISESLRLSIIRGEFPQGARLPTIHEIAKKWKTSYFTAQTALTPLVAEGLLERRRRFGTVVASGKRTLDTVGIYFGSDFMGSAEAGFYHRLYQELRTRIEKQKIGFKLWVDYRPEPEQDKPLPEMLKAILANEVQGLIIPWGNTTNISWLKELPVASSFLGSAGGEGCVSADNRQMISLAIGKLREAGCRTVGTVAASEYFLGNTDGTAVTGRFKEGSFFASECARQGLETRPEWMLYPDKPKNPTTLYGYERFHQLWSLRRRPEGLLVWPDVIVRGVVSAILELGVKVPSQLKTAFHRSKGIEPLCPFPSVWMELDVGAVADALLAQLVRRVKRQDSPSISVPFTMVDEIETGKE